MKITFVFLASLLAAVSLAETTPTSAPVSSSNVFGLLPVLSSHKATIVSVPWCACTAAGDAAISVADVVKTANLTSGDLLRTLDSNGNFLTWELVLSGGVLVWSPVVNNTANGESESPAASSVQLPRGSAFLLERQQPKDGNGAARPFYLYGQVASQAFVPMVACGSAEVPAYSLIAPPATQSVDLQDGSSLVPQAGDTIFVELSTGILKELSYAGGKWSYSDYVSSAKGPASYTTVTPASLVIPAGTGFWYVSRNSTPPSISWSGVPQK